jgi:hypothetical protein
VVSLNRVEYLEAIGVAVNVPGHTWHSYIIGMSCLMYWCVEGLEWRMEAKAHMVWAYKPTLFTRTCDNEILGTLTYITISHVTLFIALSDLENV